jgi:hypothetical protein
MGRTVGAVLIKKVPHGQTDLIQKVFSRGFCDFLNFFPGEPEIPNFFPGPAE